jgi:hypothetical protein
MVLSFAPRTADAAVSIRDYTAPLLTFELLQVNYYQQYVQTEKRYHRIYLKLVAKAAFFATLAAWLLFFFIIRRLPV